MSRIPEAMVLHARHRIPGFGVWGPAAAYCSAIVVIAVTMILGYRSQVDLRLQERTREAAVAYESVISTLAAAPELFFAQLVRDTDVTRIVRDANTADNEQFSRLNRELFARLDHEYAVLAAQDFRQLHFHTRDNRSFVRFHRPDRYGDDLTEARPTVRITNETQRPTYAFEEGRIYSGFRYVFPLVHADEHVGTVEISMSYQAIISRMQVSRAAAFDFIVRREVVEDLVFDGELANYEASCFSELFLRESAFAQPDTGRVLGVEFECIAADAPRSRRLVSDLEQAVATSVPFRIDGVDIAVSAIPIRNISGDAVAFILGYTRFDEARNLRWLFSLIGLSMALLSGLAFVLFLRVSRAHERELRLSRDLKYTMQEKDRFFSIVSHDLRGPMGSLANLAEILHDELKDIIEVPLNAREIAEVIAEGAANSSQLLSDLLDWSRSQRGDMHYAPEELSLHGLVQDQFALLRNAAASKSITLSQDTQSETVFADDYMLRTVVRNLLSNAIKFTPDGGRIHVRSRRSAAGVVVTVEDTGIGMSEAQRNSIFDLTVKSSTKGTRAEAGTGLGLKVCQEFVQAHGGTIDVESEPGTGTQIHVLFPNGPT